MNRTRGSVGAVGVSGAGRWPRPGWQVAAVDGREGHVRVRVVTTGAGSGLNTRTVVAARHPPPGNRTRGPVVPWGIHSATVIGYSHACRDVAERTFDRDDPRLGSASCERLRRSPDGLTRKNNQKNGLSNNQNTHLPLSNTTYQYHSKTIKKKPNTGMIPGN